MFHICAVNLYWSLLWNNTSKRQFVMLLKLIIRILPMSCSTRKLAFFLFKICNSVMIYLHRYFTRYYITALTNIWCSVCTDKRQIQHELITPSAIINCRRQSTCCTTASQSAAHWFDFTSKSYLMNKVVDLSRTAAHQHLFSSCLLRLFPASLQTSKLRA